MCASERDSYLTLAIRHKKAIPPSSLVVTISWTLWLIVLFAYLCLSKYYLLPLKDHRIDEHFIVPARHVTQSAMFRCALRARYIALLQSCGQVIFNSRNPVIRTQHATNVHFFGHHMRCAFTRIRGLAAFTSFEETKGSATDHQKND